MRTVNFNRSYDIPRPIRFYKKIGNMGRVIKIKMCNDFKNTIKENNENIYIKDRIGSYPVKALSELCDQTIGWTSMGFIHRYKPTNNISEVTSMVKSLKEDLYKLESENFKKTDLFNITVSLIASMMLNCIISSHYTSVSHIDVDHYIKFLLNNYREEFLTYYMTICHTLYLWKNFILDFTSTEEENGNNSIVLIEAHDFINYLKRALQLEHHCPGFPTNQVKIYEIFDEYSFGNYTWIKEKELKKLFEIDINFNKTDIEILKFSIGIMKYGGIYFDSPVENIEYLLKEKVKEVINDGRQKQNRETGRVNK